MKKKTVITTEKREIWVVREGIPEPYEDQPIDVGQALEVPLPDSTVGDSTDLEEREEV